jgi:hypothetical protein
MDAGPLFRLRARAGAHHTKVPLWVLCPGWFRLQVAIKRIGDVFRVETDTRRFLREIHILRHLNHPNIIRVLDAFYPGDALTFSELYIVFEVSAVAVWSAESSWATCASCSGLVMV